MNDFMNKIHHGDCLEFMRTIPNDYFDLVLTDPPYYKIKGDFDFTFKSFNEYLDFIETVGIEIKRILKPNGSFYIFGDDKNIAYVQVRLDKHFKLLNNLVWHKYNALPQISIMNLRSFACMSERILFYANENSSTGLELIKTDLDNFISLREYFGQLQNYIGLNKKQIINDIGQSADHCFRWKSSQWNLPTLITYNKLINKYDLYNFKFFKSYESLRLEYESLRLEYESLRRYFKPRKDINEIIKLPGINHNENTLHPTTKPTSIIKTLIERSVKVGMNVFDPFMGSGTTAIVCAQYGLEWSGCEIDSKWIDIANKRLKAIQPDMFGVIV